MRLVAFGCSNTYGQGLSDCWKAETNQAGDLPSEYAWPNILANKLGRSCINNSRPAASNKWIWNQVLKFKFNKDDIVTIMWTFPERWGIDASTKSVRLLPSYAVNKSYREHKIAKHYYKYVFDDYDHLTMSINFIDHISRYLDDIGIKNIQTFCSRYLKDRHINLVDIDFQTVLQSNPLALDNGHPGPAAHAIYADSFYERLIK